MPSELTALYRHMLRSRLFEQAVARLWHEGSISGEMHLGLGEEGICAGVVNQLDHGDALALDHRCTPPLLMRGVDPVLLLKELLGRADGLCGGRGGHMHLFSRAHLAASSGIVGASGPMAVGFALAARHLRPGRVAVCFFGEGAINQGMLMESMNLAAAWKLPVMFVCKDSQLAISTVSASVTGGSPLSRAQGCGLPAVEVDGSQVLEVRERAFRLVEKMRRGEGPCFLLSHCLHPEGHLLGDQVLRAARDPIREMGPMAGAMIRSALSAGGGSLRERVAGVLSITGMLGRSRQDRSFESMDPVLQARQKLAAEPGGETPLEQLEGEVREEILGAVRDAVEVRP
jgi:acetoin:2,6-dichlorophenolindophenol oxidoreductase subunit alpha